MDFEAQLAVGLKKLEEQNLLRALRPLQGGQQIRVQRGGRSLLNFSANDYLALASHPKLHQSAMKALELYGFGAGASRLVCGSLPPHEELESEIAHWKKSEAALSFSSGYTAALGVIPALVGTGDVILLDKLSHASLVDGARLSGANLRIFPHNNLERLQRHLIWAHKKRPGRRILIVTESIFSMDGDRCPLQEIIALKNEFGAILLLDEAHAIGILGKTGAGLVEEADCADEVEIQMGTLSKAIGTSGGYVCGSRRLVNTFVNRGRSFIFSTAPPACVAAAALEGIRIIRGAEGTQLRECLWKNITSFAQALGISPQSAIVPWTIGEESQAVETAAWLENQGYLVPAIRYPTVAKGSARIRFTLSAAHTSTEIEELVLQLSVLGCRLSVSTTIDNCVFF